MLRMRRNRQNLSKRDVRQIVFVRSAIADQSDVNGIAVRNSGPYGKRAAHCPGNVSFNTSGGSAIADQSDVNGIAVRNSGPYGERAAHCSGNIPFSTIASRIDA
jgi:hypothetical protein